MKNKIITMMQIVLVIAWITLTWKVEPIAWNIPTGFINLDQIWALIMAIITIVPAFVLQNYKSESSRKND